MAQYTLKAGQYSATNLPPVGDLYNIGLSDGIRYYGYIFQNAGQQTAGMVEKTDVASKSALQNYGSSNLVDRDLVYYPRVSQGDFSGGGLQLVAIDPTRYFDSDLDISTPGYTKLRARWNRITKSPITPGTVFSIVTWQGDFWFSFAESNKQIYSANGGATAVLPILAAVMITDGNYLYYSDGTSIYRRNTSSVDTQIAAAVNGTFLNFWISLQGTNGYFLYYLSTSGLYKIDLTAAFPVAVGAQVLLPTGSNPITVVDLSPYQNGFALLSKDPQGAGSDVWYHDGTNFTRIVRVNGYVGTGICACLGDLYMTAYPVGKQTSPVLARIGSGSYSVVSTPGSPLPTAGQTALQPVASGNKVYWPLIAPSLTGVAGTNYLSVYDVISGATSHMPVFGTDDFATNTTNFPTGQVAVLGDSVGCAFVSSGTGVCQYQSTAFGSLTYQSSGWLVSSKVDFSTPGVAKRFRRIEIHHSPLTAGQSITVKAFVDLDPIAFTTTLAPNPTVATVTHSYSASESATAASLTTLVFGQDTVGKTLYYAVQLNAGTGNLSTPKLTYTAIEIGGTWTWEFDLDCSGRRRLLNQGAEDSQGVSGKDLAFLLRNAYENGTTLTLYLAQGVSYAVAIESLENKSVAYSNHQGQDRFRADEEWLSHVVLRQVA